MPLPYTIALVTTVLLLVVLRLTVPALPIRRYAVGVTRTQVVLVLVGTVGLVLHCTAMFNRALLTVLPDSSPYIDAVNGMGASSVVLYVLPAVLVLIGLRRQPRVAVGLLVAVLTAVGVTMYDHGPLAAHLTAIFISAVLLAAVLALLAQRPRAATRTRMADTGPNP